MIPLYKLHTPHQKLFGTLVYHHNNLTFYEHNLTRLLYRHFKETSHCCFFLPQCCSSMMDPENISDRLEKAVARQRPQTVSIPGTVASTLKLLYQPGQLWADSLAMITSHLTPLHEDVGDIIIITQHSMG